MVKMCVVVEQFFGFNFKMNVIFCLEIRHIAFLPSNVRAGSMPPRLLFGKAQSRYACIV